MTRPLPTDFLDVCARLGNGYAVMRHYKCGQATFARWQKQAGHTFRKPPKPVPDDFAEVAATQHTYAMARHYGVSNKMILRWLREAGLEAAEYVPPKKISVERTKAAKMANIKPVPDDFLSKVKGMTATDLVRHYKVSRPVVKRWCRETGTAPKAYDKSRAARMQRRRELSVVHVASGIRATKLRDDVRNMDIYDIAADKLRRICPVHRCNERGGYDPKGRFWRVGWNVISPDELLMRADKMEKAA